MSVSSKKKILTVFICLLIGTCLSACSSFPFKPAKEELQSRVTGLMDAKVNNEWGEVYEYYTPSYKKNNSRESFISKNRQSTVIRYEIESIEISPSGDEATVKVKNDMSAMSFEFPGVVMTQNWVKVGWNWYLQVDTKTEKPF